jgi:hypothetical protein
LWYTTFEFYSLARYTHIDFARNIDDIKITCDHAFHLGTNMVSWESKKQPITAISSVEPKYVVATSTSCQVVWLRRLMNDLAHMKKDPTPIFYDNNSTTALIKESCISQEKKTY